MKIYDNFLPDDYFNYLSSHVMDASFQQWAFNYKVSDRDEEDSMDNYYFIHRLYGENTPISPEYNLIGGILEQLHCQAVIRARLLLYTNVGEFKKHGWHQDYDYNHKAALLYLNTCNGYTGFEDDVKVESVANRMLIFDGSVPHHSTTCTDEKYRYVLSINYF